MPRVAPKTGLQDSWSLAWHQVLIVDHLQVGEEFDEEAEGPDDGTRDDNWIVLDLVLFCRMNQDVHSTTIDEHSVDGLAHEYVVEAEGSLAGWIHSAPPFSDHFRESPVLDAFVTRGEVCDQSEGPHGNHKQSQSLHLANLRILLHERLLGNDREVRDHEQDAPGYVRDGQVLVEKVAS